YSVTPGQDSYVIGTPLFRRATLHLANGKSFRISALPPPQGAGPAPYIQSATLNGKPFERAFLRHAEIVAGGDLVFHMGPGPDRSWGVGPGRTPVSRIDAPPVLPVPYVAEGARTFRDTTRMVLASPA